MAVEHRPCAPPTWPEDRPHPALPRISSYGSYYRVVGSTSYSIPTTPSMRIKAWWCRRTVCMRTCWLDHLGTRSHPVPSHITTKWREQPLPMQCSSPRLHLVLKPRLLGVLAHLCCLVPPVLHLLCRYGKHSSKKRKSEAGRATSYYSINKSHRSL